MVENTKMKYTLSLKSTLFIVQKGRGGVGLLFCLSRYDTLKLIAGNPYQSRSSEPSYQLKMKLLKLKKK